MRAVILTGLGLVCVWMLLMALDGCGRRSTASQMAVGDPEVPIKLPKPGYVGTPPQNLYVGTTARPDDKPRQPWRAPAGVTNLALNKPVTSSDKEPIIGKLEQITDGDKEAREGSYVELAPGLQWVQVDLQQMSTIYGVLAWHRHDAARIYRDVIVQVSNDPDFIDGVKTLYNNDQDNTAGMGIGSEREYVESNLGRLVEVPKGVSARYVRLYSKGSTIDDINHYTEIEVWGK